MPCISSEKEKGGIISLDVRFPLPSVPFLAPISEPFRFLLALCTVREITGEKTAPLPPSAGTAVQVRFSNTVEVCSPGRSVCLM